METKQNEGLDSFFNPKQGMGEPKKIDNIRFKTIPCSYCVFLGQYNEYDLFFCPQDNMSTLIKAFKDE